MKKNCKLFAVVLFAALSVISCKNNFIELENENTNEKAYLTFGINENSDRKITPSKLTWNEVNSIDLTKDSSVLKTWTTTAGKYTFAVTLKDNDGDILQKGELKDVEIKVGENPLNFTSKPYLEIAIPKNLTSIENEAFNLCSSLNNIVIPDGVVSIGAFAFNGCSSLSQINIPENVVTIGERAFYSCRKLENITIPAGITEIKEATFSNTGFSSIDLSGTNISRIGDYAFAYCSDLADCEIPDGLAKENIGKDAFTGTQIDIESIYAARKI